MNWPGAHWMHMGAIAAFGNTIHAWRIADYLIMLAALYPLSRILAAAFDPRTADEEMGHFQSSLVRAAHVHAGYHSARHPSLRALGDLLRAPTLRTRQDAVTHFREVEEHVRKAM